MVAGGAAMFHQCRQLTAEGLAQGIDLRRLEHQRAEGPAHVQFTAEYLAVEGQPVAQRRLRALLGSGAFRCEYKQTVRLVKAGVDLAQVIEGDARHRQCAECLARGLVAEVAQRAEAQALVRHGAQLLLDLLDRGAKGFGRGQAHREQAGEPAQGAGQVDILEQVFTAMAFQLDQAGSLPGPLADDTRQGGQQQIVDLGAIGRRRLLQ
ncbi:hypothetical protein [Pseudomonas sp. 8 R 14]|nr:hypothetical protein [Pseudomonas sp. 8 R 14]